MAIVITEKAGATATALLPLTIACAEVMKKCPPTLINQCNRLSYSFSLILIGGKHEREFEWVVWQYAFGDVSGVSKHFSLNTSAHSDEHQPNLHPQ